MPRSVLPAFVAVDWNGTVVSFFDQPAFPRSLEVLQRLRAAGCRVCVVSRAYQRHIEADVERVGLEADEVIGCTDKGPVFAELRARLGRGVVLGDAPSDLRAAALAGLPFLQACLEGQALMPGSEGSFHDWNEAEQLLANPAP